MVRFFKEIGEINQKLKNCLVDYLYITKLFYSGNPLFLITKVRAFDKLLL